MARRPGPFNGRLVTLTSDVGWAYAAQMKAALIAGGVSPSRVLDLVHDLPAHGVREAAFLLREMARAFPPDSVHVAVIDPGVGGRRPAIVIATRAGPILVGPDNGVLMPLAEELGVRGVYRIDQGHLRSRPRVGTTFDGRDLFAPAAALLARGADPASLGPPTVATGSALPSPEKTPEGGRGEVLHVDRFGNVITNIPTEWVEGNVRWVTVRSGGGPPRRVPWATSYEALGHGVLGTLGSSFGLVEVAVGEGRAGDLLPAGVGTPVELAWRRRRAPRGENANSVRPRKAR